MMRNFVPFFVLAALASGCSPAIGLGSDDLPADGGTTSDAAPGPVVSPTSPDASSADPASPVATTLFPRIDVRVVSESRGWPVSGQLQDGVTVSVAFFKTPLTLATDYAQGADGCVDRLLTSVPAIPDLGRTSVGSVLGVAQAKGRTAVPFVLNAASFYEAELGILPAGTEVTITLAPTVPDIGGKTIVTTTKRLDLVTATAPLRFTKGQPYSVAWTEDAEGPSYWSVSDGATIPGTTMSSHRVECRATAAVRATTIATSLFEGLDWSNPATSGLYSITTNVAPQTSKTATGATLNVFSQARYASSFHVE